MSSDILLNTVAKYNKFIKGLSKDSSLFDQTKRMDFNPRSVLFDTVAETAIPNIPMGCTFSVSPPTNSTLMFGFVTNTTELTIHPENVVQLYEKMCEPTAAELVFTLNHTEQRVIVPLGLFLQLNTFHEFIRFYGLRMHTANSKKLACYFSMLRSMVALRIIENLCSDEVAFALRAEDALGKVSIFAVNYSRPAPIKKDYLGDLVTTNYSDYFMATSRTDSADNAIFAVTKDNKTFNERYRMNTNTLLENGNRLKRVIRGVH